MLLSPLRLSALYLPINHLPNNLLSQVPGYVVEGTQFKPNTTLPSHYTPPVKKISPSFGFVSSFTRLPSRKGLHTIVSTQRTFHVPGCCEQEVSGSTNSSEEKTSSEESLLDGISIARDNHYCEDHKESERRRKIGLANKGKVPWNKGRKHSAETRERIRQRTKEALRDPKVRKKMAECPRSLSNETKARIRSSLRQLWGERLKWKRSREKLLLSWAKSIAISAKKGGVGQEELHWDSHEKLKREIAWEQLQWAADKAKAKEMARVRADRAAQAKAEKMARLAEKRREQEQKAQVGGQIKRAHKKSKEEKEELAVAQELKLKARLAKIHSNKSLNGQVTSQDHRAWEKFDMNITKRDEQLQKEVSLADQIRAAKNKKAEFEAIEPLITSSSFY